MTQANIVRHEIASRGVDTVMVHISTKGDEITDRPLYDIGGKGLFISALEEALIERKIDVAVHSVKDVPAWYNDTLDIPCVLRRGSQLDVFISEQYKSITDLPIGGRVGTSSVRRKVQLLAMRPDLNIVPIRGNIDTRIAKVSSGECDGIVLAEAGLDRISRRDAICEVLQPGVMLGAVGQGAICVQCRRGESELYSLLGEINDYKSYRTVMAERSFLQTIDGSCETPLAAMAKYVSADVMTMRCMLANDAGRIEFLDRVFPEQDAEIVGKEMGQELKERCA